MTISTQRKLTLQEFLQQPELKPACEYIEGEIIQKPMPKGRHSRLQGKLCDGINRVAESDRIAYAFPELRCSFGDRAIVPDIAVFLWSKIPFTETGEVPDRFDLPPTWVIEILSPEQKPNKVIDNILYCLNFGSRLGWFLDPDDASVLVFEPQQQPRLYRGDDVLPVLEEIPLQLTIDRVYGWLKMQ
ncbi:MAG: Uma2 family endonuclease [Geitlerinemataceae cyanobacterium]